MSVTRKYFEGEELPPRVEWREERVIVAYAPETGEIVEEHTRSSTPIGFGLICENPHSLDDHHDFRVDETYVFSTKKNHEEGCPACTTDEERRQEAWDERHLR